MLGEDHCCDSGVGQVGPLPHPLLEVHQRGGVESHDGELRRTGVLGQLEVGLGYIAVEDRLGKTEPQREHKPNLGETRENTVVGDGPVLAIVAEGDAELESKDVGDAQVSLHVDELDGIDDLRRCRQIVDEEGVADADQVSPPRPVRR